jgi:hypothetical protein
MVMSWGSVKKGLPRIAAGILSISAFLLSGRSARTARSLES